MRDIRDIRNIRQIECIDAIEKGGYNCTIKASVGFGKTIMSQRLLHRMLEKSILKKGDRVLFQTSTTNLINSYKSEAELCNDWFGFNVLELFDMKFACYEALTLCKESFDYVINDEVDVVGEKRFACLEGYTGKMLNMSGTLSQAQKLGEISKFAAITKERPLVFDYSLKQAQEEGIVTGFQTILIKVNLDDKRPYKKVFKNGKEETERGFNTKCVSMVEENRFTKPFMVKRYGLMATNLCKATPSKIKHIQQLIKDLSSEGKRGLVWSPFLTYLEQVMPGRVELPKDSVIDRFNSKEFDCVGFSKKLGRGQTPVEIDYLILTSPISKIHELEQILGRTIRLDSRPDKFPTLYIFMAEDTYEDRYWLKRGMSEKVKSKTVRTLDLNIVEVITL